MSRRIHNDRRKCLKLKMLLDFWDKRDRTIVLCSILSGVLLLVRQNAIAVPINWIGCLLIGSVWLSSPASDPKIFWRVGFNYIMTMVAAVLIPVRYGDMVGLAICQLVLSIFTSIILFLFPSPSACPITGPYHFIGTTSFTLDLKTVGVHEEGIDHKLDFYNNTLSVQCWFPIEYENASSDFYWRLFGSRALLWTSGKQSEQYYESVELLKQIAINFKIPNLVLRHHSLSRMNSIWQYDLSKIRKGNNKMPIAIYSHGMYGWRQIASSTCENLASYGFLVFACDHTPDCMLTRPIGQRNQFKPFDYFPPKGCSDFEERYFYGCGVNRRVNNLQQLLDFITSGSLEKRYPTLVNRLDFEKICVWGHSFGANTVTSLSCVDYRPSKVIALDAWMYPMPNHIRQRGIQNAALLSLSAHQWPYAKYQVPFRRECIANSTSRRPMFDMVIKGTDHQNYCDTHLIASKYLLQRPTVLGNGIEPINVARNLDLLVTAFFSVSAEDTLDLPRTPEALLEHLSSGNINDDTVMLGDVVFSRLRRFILDNIVEESTIEGFCDKTYFDKVNGDKFKSELEMQEIVLIAEDNTERLREVKSERPERDDN